MAYFKDKELLKKLGRFRVTDFQFPTDQISIGDLRRQSPSDFDWNLEASNHFFDRESFSITLDNALYYERNFALLCWCEQKEIPSEPFTDFKLAQKDELMQMLHQSYEEIGLARSIEETKGYAQQIEAQVASLVKKSSPVR